MMMKDNGSMNVKMWLNGIEMGKREHEVLNETN